MPSDSRQGQVRISLPHVVERDIQVLIYDYDRVTCQTQILSAGSVFQPWEPTEFAGGEIPITLGDQALEFDWGKTAWDGHFLRADDYFANCVLLEDASK